MDCGIDDPMETALANGDYDPCTNTWRSPEVLAEYQRAYPKDCPCPGSRNHDPYGRRLAPKEKGEPL